MTDQRWACQWCGHKSPVPSMNDRHELTCPAKPAEETR